MSDRTEAPTPRRRDEARRKGQVTKSTEINSAAILLTAFWMLNTVGPNVVETMNTLMKRSFTTMSSTSFIHNELTFNTLKTGGLTVGGLALQSIAPLVGTLLVVGVVANLGQVGFMFSQEALKPDFQRVSPLTGWKRVFSGRSLVEFFKSLLKIVIIGFVVYKALQDNYPMIASTSRMTLSTAVSTLTQVALAVGLRVGTVMVVLAAADYLFQRHEFEKGLRMTKQEIIEEAKSNENPQLKSRIRSRQRQLAMSRMMAAVPKADVVITNPTHLAIALRYDRSKMRAPQVVAKGEQLVAERIKEKAREHRVPLVENKPLARTLFKAVEIGHEVPPELFQAVAEVLAFVFRLKANRL
ncbi:MAG: flagellar biosynthesis protein FlhB [Anaerolineales bacterium]|nr:flagellar biosynthesis protein FlhB [Anaerolineales bacterium]